MLKKKINRKNMIDSIIEMSSMFVISMVQVSFIHFLFEMALDI